MIARRGKSPTISAVLITLNEAHRLPKLLTRLGWVDEIVVLDGGSTDGTIDLARRHGCQVHTHPFDHFAAQRNRALAAATSDWVLSIDADETPTAGLVAEIRTAIRDRKTAGWRVPIRSRIFGHPFRYSGTQDDRPVRLVRRGAALWLGAVHEVLCVDGPIGQLTSHLEHDTIPDFESFVAKVERYTSLAAETRLHDECPPRLADALWAPPREALRRLLWKRGWLDGPPGWAFCLLSGWSEWVLARKHRQLWKQRYTARLATT